MLTRRPLLMAALAAPFAAPARAQTPAAVPAADAAPTTAPAPAPTTAPATPAATGAMAQLPPTVTKNYPLTPEGNARFLADYAARPDVKKLTGGTLYRVLHPSAKGAIGPLGRGDSATCSYRGWLIDGTVFEQTKPGQPVAFTLSVVIPGWREALLKMKIGDLWELAIPSDQAYGVEGRPGKIPPNQTLVFVISLAAVAYAG
jgi:FKBP-type peptidyl-prolyl cis-trans isomerase